MEKQSLRFYKVENDAYGNPRYVVGFMELLSSRAYDAAEGLGERYKEARRTARLCGGTVYRGEEYGGGFVFQSYNVADLFNRINKLCDGEYSGYEVYKRGWVCAEVCKC